MCFCTGDSPTLPRLCRSQTLGSCACHTVFPWRNNLAAAPDLRVHQRDTEEMQKIGKHTVTEGQGRTGPSTHGGHCSEVGGAPLALLSFALEQLYLLFHTMTLMGYYWCHSTGHSTRSKEPQAFLTILYLDFKQTERKFALTFAFISLNSAKSIYKHPIGVSVQSSFKRLKTDFEIS